MNKYEKALKDLHRTAYPNACECWCAETELKHIKVLQELVERATPKKTMKFHYCPSCKKHTGLSHYSFCPNCGQLLDWSDTK